MEKSALQSNIPLTPAVETVTPGTENDSVDASCSSLSDGREVTFCDSRKNLMFEPGMESARSAVDDSKHAGIEQSNSEALDELDQEETGSMENEQEEHRSRCSCRLREACPRIYAVAFRIVLPLWLLIAFTSFCGYYLARFEAPAEYDQNDFILSKQILETGRIQDGFNYNLPLRCFDNYLEDRFGLTPGDFFATNHSNETELEASNLEDLGFLESVYDSVLVDTTNVTGDWNVSTNATPTERLENFLTETRDYMEACGNVYGGIALNLYEYARRINDVLAASRLTFTWIRCWNETEHGPLLWTLSPSPEQLAAAQNQSSYYEEVWTTHQEELYEKYLLEYPDNPAGRLIAFNRSIEEATGRHSCANNVGGTSWFWFTIMSTVGYGNQSPETKAGKNLVVTMGTVSILLFGFILVIAGQVCKALAEDVWNFLGWKILTRPLLLSVMWGAGAFGWMFIIGAQANHWWETRLPPSEEEDLTTRNGWWFAYISSTTIGLGDFFFQPEYMFMGDVLWFSFIFLAGFVVLSTFISSLAESLVFIVHVNTFGERFRRDQLKRMISGKYDSESGREVTSDVIEQLNELLGKSRRYIFDDNSPREYRLRQLIEEEKLTRELLRQTRERALSLYPEKDGASSDIFRENDASQLRKEEELFVKLSNRISLERMAAENDYQSMGAMPPSEMTSSRRKPNI